MKLNSEYDLKIIKQQYLGMYLGEEIHLIFREFGYQDLMVGTTFITITELQLALLTNSPILHKMKEAYLRACALGLVR